LKTRIEGREAPLSWNDLRIYLCVIPSQKRSIDDEKTHENIKKLKLSLNTGEIQRAQMQGEMDEKVRALIFFS
jgi:hypothetical protein